jgi:hypothetical protein
MFEARAVLLGRLGKHDGALETYVYRIGDFNRAEEYVRECLTKRYQILIDATGTARTYINLDQIHRMSSLRYSRSTCNRILKPQQLIIYAQLWHSLAVIARGSMQLKHFNSYHRS